MDEQTFANDVRADRVDLSRSAVRNLTAASARLERSAVQRLTAETAEVQQSMVGVANATTLELTESTAALVAGDYVKVQDSRVFILLAPRVNGNVQAVLTLPAAFALGVGYFLARRLALGLFRPGRG